MAGSGCNDLLWVAEETEAGLIRKSFPNEEVEKIRGYKETYLETHLRSSVALAERVHGAASACWAFQTFPVIIPALWTEVSRP